MATRGRTAIARRDHANLLPTAERRATEFRLEALGLSDILAMRGRAGEVEGDIRVRGSATASISQPAAPTPGAANDPYAAFRQVLALVTGDVEASLAAGVLDVEQAERLWRLIPRSVQVLTDVAPDVLDTLVPAARLLARARAAAATGVGDRGWVAGLEQLVARAGSPASPAPNRDDLVSEAIDLLQAISREHPVLLVVDDLQWADAASIGLLFQLASEVAGHRMLAVGAYRPADLSDFTPGARHPLEAAVHVRRSGEATIPLPEQGDQAFVDGLVDAEPNRLGAEFRQTLFQQTRGHPLFTVELLRALRQAGALQQDAAGRWHEGSTLDWNTLPARVEAAVAERVARLPRHLRRLLDVASIEGEEFTAEVVARVTGVSERETVLALADEVDKRHWLARLQSLTRVNDSRVSIYRFEHVITSVTWLAAWTKRSGPTCTRGSAARSRHSTAGAPARLPHGWPGTSNRRESFPGPSSTCGWPVSGRSSCRPIRTRSLTSRPQSPCWRSCLRLTATTPRSCSSSSRSSCRCFV